MKSLRFVPFLLVFGFVFFVPRAYAQSCDAQMRAQEPELCAEYDAVNADIAKWQAELDKTKQGTRSLQNDAATLQAKINEAKAFIRKRQLQIEQLTGQIIQKTTTINELQAKINRGKESLASMIRSTRELDYYSLAEVVLSNENLSDFFEDIDLYNSVNAALAVQFSELRGNQSLADAERKALDKKRVEEADTKAKMEEERKRVERDEAEKQRLIAINKSQEQSYAQVIAEKEKRAAQIRAALFSLRDTEGIPFGDALKYATTAAQATGVRPALILAILTQESDLGKNQGSCLVNNLETGDGAGKNTGTAFEQVMKAPRDTAPFKDITDRLNKDWKMTPVSCPPGHEYYSGRGFGGGMGPSQFIPSTWELFKARIGAAVGVSANQANPWNPQHAIMATAIYMADLGAANGGATAERNAACKYYSGRSCDSKAPANSFYGTQVLAKAANIQTTMIDPLNF